MSNYRKFIQVIIILIGSIQICNTLAYTPPPDPDMTLQNGPHLVNDDLITYTISINDFGNADINGGTVDYTFTIYNAGPGDLWVGVFPYISISGDHAADFSILSNLSSPMITSDNNDSFTIHFDPSDASIRNATIKINTTNDPRYDDYTFAVRGTGVDGSLSVELTSFHAFASTNGIELKWTTESEIDNIGYILERKSNSDWITITSYMTNKGLKGQGNCSCATDYTFTDSDVATGETYSYRLSDVDFEGKVTIKDAISITLDDAPELTDLLPATPNPFNPSTKIQYTLAQNSNVNLRVVNMKGQTVQTIISGQNQTAGSYSVHWNGQNDTGINAPTGIYLLVLNAGQIIKSQKVMLVR